MTAATLRAAVRMQASRVAQFCRRRAYALLFFGLLAAVLAVTLYELPPLRSQPGFSSDAQLMLQRDAVTAPDKINVNTAVAAELTCLSGIGEKKAQAILDYRQQHGPFESIAALENVPGISHKMILKIQDQITV